MADVVIQEELYSCYAQKFKALSDPNRLRIVDELSQRGKTCVCDLTDLLALPQSKLSYHLKMLLDARLIHMERIGKWNYYELNEEEVKGILSEELCRIFCP